MKPTLRTLRRLLLLLAVPAIVPTPVAAQTPALADLPEIQVGQEVEGRLWAESPESLNWGPFEVFRFQGEAGVRYVADARSGDFDTYLVLAHAVGGITEFLQEDDDGGEGTDARLRFRLDRDGTYLLVVRGWGMDRGRFTLSLAELPPPPPAEVRGLQVGQPVQGELSLEGSLFETEWGEEIPFDIWTFEGAAGDVIQVAMDSDDFDAYVELGTLEGDQFTSEASDDDGGEGSNALLHHRLLRDGTFAIRARSFGSWSAEGRYTLRVDPYVPEVPVRRPIAIGERVEADLTMDDALLVDLDAVWSAPTRVQEWELEGRAGDRLEIRMRSDDFDTVLSLGREEADGFYRELAFNDDAPDDGLNSLIEFQLPADGTYLIRARAFNAGSTGRYTLEVNRGG
ncbi:MAG: hypothetical protein EA422_02775 [Gemmatimonadales bacterium]|nr:MAG: hypothetical protein EA422_02775 [Gemmatimonadales bacterium]